jgi:hypothetical protein
VSSQLELFSSDQQPGSILDADRHDPHGSLAFVNFVEYPEWVDSQLPVGERVVPQLFAIPGLGVWLVCELLLDSVQNDDVPAMLASIPLMMTSEVTALLQAWQDGDVAARDPPAAPRVRRARALACEHAATSPPRLVCTAGRSRSTCSSLRLPRRAESISESNQSGAALLERPVALVFSVR